MKRRRCRLGRREAGEPERLEQRLAPTARDLPPDEPSEDETESHAAVGDDEVDAVETVGPPDDRQPVER